MNIDRHEKTSKRLYPSCVLIFLITAGFFVITQVETMVQSCWPVCATWRIHALGKLLFVQGESLGLAFLYAALFAKCQPWRRVRLVFAGWLTLYLTLLVIDQLFYTAFSQHIQLSLQDIQGLSITRLMDSIISRLGAVFIFNLVLTAGLSSWLFRQLLPGQRRHNEPAWFAMLLDRHANYSALVGSVVLLGGVSAAYAADAEHHPLLTLAASLIQHAHPAPKLTDYDPALDLDTLRYGQSAFAAHAAESLLAYEQSQRQRRSRPPNIVYLILESVGSINLLSNGTPDPVVTPNLHWLMPHAILFPALYNNLPGSERAHWAIHTGGVAYTWGGDFVQAGYTYTGPTLVGCLKQLDYQTGLFSAAFMDSENFREVYKNLPFDTALIPDDEPIAYNKAHLLNSWGIDEAEMMRRALAWLDSRPATPFFLLFLNSNTHHPYSVPKDYPKPFAGKDELTYYRNALYFMDGQIGRLVAYLAEHQLLDNTIIAISGDHGESFGQRHPTNFFHGSQLYEENIKNFLLLLDFTQTAGPLIADKQGSIGDIMPTLLTLAGGVAPQLPGQNLFAPTYQEHIRYFHTELMPEKWGLLDGEWKFITQRTGETRPELYDLRQDSAEQNNLAALLPEHSDLYTRLLAHWYVRSNQKFVEQLAD